MFLSGKAGRDLLRGGAGGDTLYGFGGDDTLVGAGGHDVLAGHEGADSLSGGAGDDYMLGGAGNDVLDGGAGVDWAAYEDAASGVRLDLSLTVAQDTLGGGCDKVTGVENAYGSAFNDTLTGNAMVNYLSGGVGDDRLEGGAGQDTILGGDGWDVVSYDGATRGVNVDLAAGRATDGGSFPEPPGDTDLLSGVEDVYGSAHNDVIGGDQNDNYLIGNGGDDQLHGATGADTLVGGAGDDTFRHNVDARFAEMHGGDGVDTFFADPRWGWDMVFDLRDGSVTVDGVRTVAFSSIEYFVGGKGQDVFHAAVGKSVFVGDFGSDRFIFAPGSAAASTDAAQLDTIVRFSGFISDEENKISLGVTGNYQEASAATYADAYSAANALIASGARDIVATQVGGDVYVFADSLQINAMTTAIKLEIADLSVIQASDFI